MNVIVCIKQVPGSATVEIDPVTGVLMRDAADVKLNPYDLYAIEEALILTEKTGGTATAMSMGPPRARGALLEAVYMGVDRAVLISDKCFAGSDVLSTAYALSQAARACGFDLIVCGRQTTDGDTAQVGAELAEFLGVPHATNVLSIEVEKSGAPRSGPCDTLHNGRGGLIVSAAQENRIVTQYMPLPCLLCIDGGVNTPRLPSYKRKRGLPADPVLTLSVSDLGDINETHYGLDGSPTQVEHIFTPEANTRRETMTGDSGQLAERLAAVLSERKFI